MLPAGDPISVSILTGCPDFLARRATLSPEKTLRASSVASAAAGVRSSSLQHREAYTSMSLEFFEHLLEGSLAFSLSPLQGIRLPRLEHVQSLINRSMLRHATPPRASKSSLVYPQVTDAKLPRRHQTRPQPLCEHRTHRNSLVRPFRARRIDRHLVPRAAPWADIAPPFQGGLSRAEGLKGRIMKAQGSALGFRIPPQVALKGRANLARLKL